LLPLDAHAQQHGKRECTGAVQTSADARGPARLDVDRGRQPVKIATPTVDWLTLAPELSLLAAAAVCLMAAVLVPAPWRRGVGAFFALAGFITAGIFAGVLFDHSTNATLEVGNAIVRDRLGAFGAFVICGAGVLAVFVSYSHRMRDAYVAEYYALLATAGAGMC